MTSAGSLWYTLGAKPDKLDADLKQADAAVAASGKKAADSFEKPMTAAQGKVREGFTSVQKALGAIGIGLGIATVTKFFGDTISAASDLNETVNKTQVVFGDASAAVLKMGEDSAHALGMSKNEALAAAATYGNLFRAIGLTTDKSAEMSTKLVGLAADLASFNNANPEEVLEALRSGLVGEVEPLRKFGINLSEARLKQEALNEGLDASGPTLSAASKAQAAYAIILQDSTLAQGDFARTASGLANSQRTAAAVWEDTQARIGAALLPVVTEFEHFAIEVLPAVGDAISAVMTIVAPLLGMLLELSKTLLQHANVVIPLVAAALGVKLYGSLVTAAKGFDIAKISAKGMWSAILLGLPVLFEAADALDDWSLKLGKNADQMSAIDRLQSELGTSAGGTRMAYELANAISQKYGLSLDFIIGRMVDAKAKGGDWKDALKGMADGQFGSAEATDFAAESIRNETRDLQHNAAQHGRTAAAARQAAQEVSQALTDQLSAIDEVVPESIRRTAEGIAVTLKDGSTVIATDGSIAAAVGQAVEAGKNKAKEVASGIPQAIVDAIVGGPAEISAAKKRIEEILSEAMSDTATVTTDAGIIAGKNVTTGFTKGSTQQRTQLLTEIDALATSINTLNPKALETGKGIPKSMQKGVSQNLSLAVDEVERLRDASGSKLDLADFAELQGLHGIAAYIRGIEAKKQGAANAMIATRRAVEHEAKLNLYDAGYNTGNSWVNGVIGAMGYNSGARQRIAQEARLATLDLMGHSPPRTGPLREIDKEGFNVGHAWVSNVVRAISSADVDMALASMRRGLSASGVLAALGGAGGLTPAMAGGTAGPAATGSAPVYNDYRQYHVHADGPVSTETDADLARVMDRVLFGAGAQGAVGG